MSHVRKPYSGAFWMVLPVEGTYIAAQRMVARLCAFARIRVSDAGCARLVSVLMKANSANLAKEACIQRSGVEGDAIFRRGVGCQKLHHCEGPMRPFECGA